MTGVNWFDVQDYIAWAKVRSGLKLRLRDLAEWRELDRTLVKPKKVPLFTDPRLAWAAIYGQEETPGGAVRPNGSFSTTPDGVSDLDGNVWERTSSCYKARMDGKDCPASIAAGAHEAPNVGVCRQSRIGRVCYGHVTHLSRLSLSRRSLTC